MTRNPLSRRGLLRAALGAAGSALWHSPAAAMGRRPVGGSLVLELPWALSRWDPHRIDDIPTALFGSALFDTLYVRIEGQFLPLLAEEEPTRTPTGLRVLLRKGIHTAGGRRLDAEDVAWSLRRALSLGARGLGSELGSPRSRQGLAIDFSGRDPQKLMRRLSLPITAIVPKSFTPSAPEGTGPFRWSQRGATIVLSRNPRATRGPSFLDEISLSTSSDIAASLRAFESGRTDVGWLGTGLHEPRKGAKTFDVGHVGWAVLRMGLEAKNGWDAPGIAQALADGIPPASLAPLAMGPPWVVRPSGWAGGPSEVLVRDDSPFLVELARTVADSLQRPNSELAVRTLGAAEFAQRLRARNYTLAIDVVRDLTQGPEGPALSIATAEGAPIGRAIFSAGRRSAELPRDVTRKGQMGVLGEIRVQGGRVSDLVLPPWSGGSVDWGLAYRARRGVS